MADSFTLASAAARELEARTGVDRHDLVVVLGSGWAEVADLLPVGAEVAMADLPGFVAPSVRGHDGTLRSVAVGSARVLLAHGRVHLYEGRSPAEVVHAVRTAASAGCRTAVFTNAAGALHADWPVGAPVLIADQLNFTGASPLEGPEFVDLTDLYSNRLRELVRSLDPTVREGVYVGTRGPEFESPAEIRAYATLGADLVGMSTVLEAIAARHLGMEVLGLSMVTNPAAGLGEAIDPHHVFAAGAAHGASAAELLLRTIEAIASHGG